VSKSVRYILEPYNLASLGALRAHIPTVSAGSIAEKKKEKALSHPSEGWERYSGQGEVFLRWRSWVQTRADASESQFKTITSQKSEAVPRRARI